MRLAFTPSISEKQVSSMARQVTTKMAGVFGVLKIRIDGASTTDLVLEICGHHAPLETLLPWIKRFGNGFATVLLEMSHHLHHLFPVVNKDVIIYYSKPVPFHRDPHRKTKLHMRSQLLELISSLAAAKYCGLFDLRLDVLAVHLFPIIQEPFRHLHTRFPSCKKELSIDYLYLSRPVANLLGSFSSLTALSTTVVQQIGKYSPFEPLQ
jgi:hypothetical protein